jgi:hypothetical protein
MDDALKDFDDYFGEDEEMPPYWREPVSTGWDDHLDADIADAAGLDSRFVNERQVPSHLQLHASQVLKFPLPALNVTVVDLQKLSTTINKNYDHCAECERCKKWKRPTKTGHCDWIMDSGASKHFTYDLSDFAEYHPFNGPMLNTANKDAPLQVKGDGTVFLTQSYYSPSSGLPCPRYGSSTYVDGRIVVKWQRSGEMLK